jgi:CMP/dCMP kinase
LQKIIIAIDGHSSCGKSTLAKALASSLDYIYVDSGAMYRAVTYFLIQNNVPLEESELLVQSLSKINIRFFKDKNLNAITLLNGVDVSSEIREKPVNDKVSEVAALSSVRKKLVEEQRNIGINRGIVMDGRDIGTVVFKDAELKVFLTASHEIRASRRFNELLSKGIQTTLEEVSDNLQKRDLIDSTREDSPLVKAYDAKLLDNSILNEKEQLEVVLKWAREAIALS